MSAGRREWRWVLQAGIGQWGSGSSSRTAGKSTLLRILAGKRLTKTRDCRILGQDVFMNPPHGVVYLGTEWSSNPVVRSDIVVSDFLDSVGGYRHKERRDRLLRILDVDLDW